MKKEYFKPILEVVEYDIDRTIALNPSNTYIAGETDAEGENYDDVVWQ